MTQQFIRRAVESDAPRLAELAATTFYESFAARNTPENMSAYLAASFSPEKQRAELVDPGNTFLMVENDGVEIGYAHLRRGTPPECVSDPHAIELVRLYLSSKFQSGGIGGKLMDACLTEARNAGHQTIWLGVWQQNTRAKAFYDRWGFTVVGEHVFQLGTDPQMDWIMERSL